MVREKVGVVGEVVLLGSERGDTAPIRAVIVGHDSSGAPETMPFSALSSPEDVERYLGAQRGKRFIQIARTLELMR